jgi:hypothetical protein
MNNEEKALAAVAGLKAYQKAKGSKNELPTHPEDFEDLVGDLMADALHEAKRRGATVDLLKLALRAQDHFEYEVLEEKDPEAATIAFNTSELGGLYRKLTIVKQALGE